MAYGMLCGLFETIGDTSLSHSVSLGKVLQLRLCLLAQGVFPPHHQSCGDHGDARNSGERLSGSGGAQGLGFRFSGLGFRGLGFRSLGCRV